MKRRNLRRLFLVLMLVWPVVVNAQTGIPSADVDHIDLKVYFRGGSTKILPNFSNNQQNIDEFVSKAQALQRDDNFILSHITALGSASPDSVEQANMNLSMGRAEVIFKYLSKYIALPPSQWQPAYIGEDWDGFLKGIRESNKSYKYEVEQIILNTPAKIVKDGKWVGGRKETLKNLDGGRTWRDMQRDIFPPLRQVTVQLFYKAVKPAAPDTVTLVMLDTVYIDRVIRDTVDNTVYPEKRDNWRPVFAIKTNGLYDIAMVPTIGIEIPFGNRVSLAANWSYSWWKNDQKEFYNRTYGGDADLRFWFGTANRRTRLAGHHVGVFGQMFTADFLLGKLGLDTGVLSGQWNYAAGVEYGYSFDIAKRFRLDLSVGAGHIWGEYQTYQQAFDYEKGEYLYLHKGTYQYPAIVPTKAEISFVWVLGRTPRFRDSQR